MKESWIQPATDLKPVPRWHESLAVAARISRSGTLDSRIQYGAFLHQNAAGVEGLPAISISVFIQAVYGPEARLRPGPAAGSPRKNLILWAFHRFMPFQIRF
jgi:hypothetical protein